MATYMLAKFTFVLDDDEEEEGVVRDDRKDKTC